jgi:indole-3-glycerol phosphate synthase
MSDFLEAMGAASRSRIQAIRDLPPITDSPPPVPLTVTPDGFDVIAEAKLAGPASGRLIAASQDDTAAVVRLATGFEDGGAIAVSVLTEPSTFSGSLDHLRAAARTTHLPVMRKDFLVDPRQVEEARAFGASGVLLIARLLVPSLLAEMTDLALALGMFPLVELFSPADLDTATIVFDRPILLGVNARDLATLEVDPKRLAEMRGLLPDGVITVAESGIRRPEEAERIADLGYRMALIGTSLVMASDPRRALADILGAGRAKPTPRTA